MQMKISVLGVDIGKNVCSLVGLDAAGNVVSRRRVTRETLIGLAMKLSPCIVAMEACCGAHNNLRASATSSAFFRRPLVPARRSLSGHHPALVTGFHGHDKMAS